MTCARFITSAMPCCLADSFTCSQAHCSMCEDKAANIQDVMFIKQLCFASKSDVLLIQNAFMHSCHRATVSYMMAEQHTECARPTYSFAELLLGIQSMHPEEVLRHLGRA